MARNSKYLQKLTKYLRYLRVHAHCQITLLRVHIRSQITKFRVHIRSRIAQLRVHACCQIIQLPVHIRNQIIQIAHIYYRVIPPTWTAAAILIDTAFQAPPWRAYIFSIVSTWPGPTRPPVPTCNLTRGAPVKASHFRSYDIITGKNSLTFYVALKTRKRNRCYLGDK